MSTTDQTPQENTAVEDTPPKKSKKGKGRLGRPMIYDKKLVPTTVTLRADQKEKLLILGGAAWVRQMIDEAQLPED